MSDLKPTIKDEVSFEEIDFSEIEVNPTRSPVTPTASIMEGAQVGDTLNRVSDGADGVPIGGLTVEDEGEGKLDTPARILLAGSDFPKKFCCGWANGGRDNKICLKPAKHLDGGCNYQSHANKCEVPLDSLIITLKLGRVGFCGLAEPLLPKMHLLPSDELSELTSKEHPLATLVKFFEDRIDFASRDSKTPRAPRTLKQVKTSFKEVQSPRAVEEKMQVTREAVEASNVKMKLEFDDEASSKDLETLANSLEGLSMLLEDHAVKDILLSIGKLSVDTMQQIKKLRLGAKANKGHLSDLLDRIEEVFTFTQNINLNLGDPPRDGNDLAGTPMWKIINAFHR